MLTLDENGYLALSNARRLLGQEELAELRQSLNAILTRDLTEVSPAPPTLLSTVRVVVAVKPTDLQKNLGLGVSPSGHSITG